MSDTSFEESSFNAKDSEVEEQPLVKSPSSKDEPDVGELSLSGKPAREINYFSVRNVGLFVQYFIVGIVSSFCHGINYEFFRSYLGQDGNMYNITIAAIMLPWSFKIVFGAVHDCFPIRGYRRKPYMALGWLGCAVVATVLFSLPLPEPRFHITVTEEDIRLGNCEKHHDEHRLYRADTEDEYRAHAVKYMALLMLLNTFLVFSDVAMDGLMVQYARLESMERRGRAQTLVYVSRTVGLVFATLVKGFGLNWYKYSGPWCSGLEVTHLFLSMIVVSLIAIPVVLFMTTEELTDERPTIREILKTTWRLLKSTAIQQILVFQIGAAILSSVSSPADSMIMSLWVQPTILMKNVLTGILGNLCFGLGSLAFAHFLMNRNWVSIYGVTVIFITLLNVLVTYLTIYDVVRNQYVYFSDDVSTDFFQGVNFICALLLFVEISEAGNEGLSYALLTTAVNASQALGPLIGNLIGMPFKVSGEGRYLSDTMSDRNIIGVQYGIVFLLNAAVIVLLPLLPPGKAATQALKKNAGQSVVGACVFCVFVVLAVGTSVFASFGLTTFGIM